MSQIDMWNCRDRTIKTVLKGLVLLILLAGTGQSAHALTVQSTKLQQAVAAVETCASAADCPFMDVKGYTTIVFQVIGPFTGSVQFEAAVNKDLGFASLECFSTASRSTSVTSTTVAGAWRCNVIGFNYARTRVDAYSSGSITVVAGAVSAGVN